MGKKQFLKTVLLEEKISGNTVRDTVWEDTVSEKNRQVYFYNC